MAHVENYSQTRLRYRAHEWGLGPSDLGCTKPQALNPKPKTWLPYPKTIRTTKTRVAGFGAFYGLPSVAALEKGSVGGRVSGSRVYELTVVFLSAFAGLEVLG